MRTLSTFTSLKPRIVMPATWSSAIREMLGGVLRSKREPGQLDRPENLLHNHVANTLAKTKASIEPFLGPECREQFLLSCWSLQLKGGCSHKVLEVYQSYFRHYEQFCSFLSTSYPLLEDCVHETFCQAVQLVQQGLRRSCEAKVQALLPPASQSAEAARDCINFIGKAILLIDLIEWELDETLAEFVSRVIASRSIQDDQYRIPLSFNAHTFEELAGIKILWTRDLLAHLEVGLNDSTLALFHNVKVLHLYEQSDLFAIFPDGFIAETKRTISLMLPVADKSCAKWFKLKQQRLGLDMTAGNCQHLRATQRNIQDFDFWRDRLIVAKETFDLSQPHGLLHFWRDDRNKVQWWTFWIAIVVFLLTAISVIEGALQVYKAYHPSR